MSDTPRTDDLRAKLDALPKFGYYGFDPTAPMKLVLDEYAKLERELAAERERRVASEALVQECTDNILSVLCESNGIFDNEWITKDGKGVPEYPIGSFCAAIEKMDKLFTKLAAIERARSGK